MGDGTGGSGPAPSTDLPQRPWWRDPGAAIGDRDLGDLASRLDRLRGGRWWWRPVGYFGVALLGLAGAFVTLTSNWRLILLEITPAVWLGAITWQWRRVALFGGDRPVVAGAGAWAVGVLVVAATAASYWCNVTFALTVRRPGPPSIRVAFAEARSRAGWVWSAVAVTAAAHLAVVVWLVRVEGSWFELGLGAVAVLQMYAFVAVPVVVATGRLERRSWPERARSSAASLGVSGMTSAPGVVLNRIGVVCLGIGLLRWFGVALITVAALVQVAGISSAAALKFAGRLGTP